MRTPRSEERLCTPLASSWTETDIKIRCTSVSTTQANSNNLDGDFASVFADFLPRIVARLEGRADSNTEHKSTMDVSSPSDVPACLAAWSSSAEMPKETENARSDPSAPKVLAADIRWQGCLVRGFLVYQRGRVLQTRHVHLADGSVVAGVLSQEALAFAQADTFHKTLAAKTLASVCAAAARDAAAAMGADLPLLAAGWGTRRLRRSSSLLFEKQRRSHHIRRASAIGLAAAVLLSITLAAKKFDLAPGLAIGVVEALSYARSRLRQWGGGEAVEVERRALERMEAAARTAARIPLDTYERAQLLLVATTHAYVPRGCEVSEHAHTALLSYFASEAFGAILRGRVTSLPSKPAAIDEMHSYGTLNQFRLSCGAGASSTSSASSVTSTSSSSDSGFIDDASVDLLASRIFY